MIPIDQRTRQAAHVNAALRRNRQRRTLLPVLCLFLAGSLVVGCTSSRLYAPKYDDLAQVNLALRGERATIRLSDGSQVTAQNVHVLPDSVHFNSPPFGTPRIVPTSLVREIAVTRRVEASRGFVAGAFPGAVLLGMGLYGLATCAGHDLGCGLGSSLSTVVGGLAFMIGGGIGATLSASSKARVVIYREPLSRYLRERENGPHP